MTLPYIYHKFSDAAYRKQLSCFIIKRVRKMGNIFDRSVFLVDDEPELRRMVEQILKEAGFRDVLLASSCQEARRIFRTKTPQLVL